MLMRCGTQFLKLLCLFTCIYVKQSTSNVINQTAMTDTMVTYYQAALTYCELFWNDAYSKEKLHEFLLEGDVKLIEFHLHFDNTSVTRNTFGYMFKPQEWSLATGRHGRGLLMLQYNYEVLSLTTLNVGVEKLGIPLEQSPHGCLWRMNASDVEQQVRKFLLNETAREGDQICNMGILQKSTTADFAYICCHKNTDGETVCDKLTTDKWIRVLLIFIMIIKILVVLYTPLFVPDGWYRLKFVASEYVYHCETPKQITVFKTKNPESFSNFKFSAKISRFAEMPKFRKTLNDLKMNTPYSMAMRNISLRVKSRRLVPEENAPVSVRRSLYHSVCRCKIREKPAVNACCQSNIFGRLMPFKKLWPWYKCLQGIMQGILLIIVAVPWIVRIGLFFCYEEDEVLARESAADSQHLRVAFPGNATLYLTPLHGAFIFVYFIILVDTVIFGILRKHVQNRFKYVLRKCFRDMKERSRFEILGWAVNTLLKPLQKFGIAGIILGIPFWVIALPVCAIIMAFYMFPTLNISIRLLAHFVAHLIPEDIQCTKNRIFKRMREMADDNLNLKTISNKESLERSEATSIKGRLFQLLVITMCLISLYSITFLLMECISFFVEIGIYTMMGVILNSGKTMRFVTLILLLVFYGNDCFKSVNKKYFDFNKVINGAICKKAGEKLKDTALQDEDIQKNTAFRIEAENITDETDTVEFVVKENIPKWRTNGVILFLDNQDAPYIPERFFFETCYLPHFGCPGALYLNLIKAMSQFILIIIFLLFVVIVVLAFGDVYRISATNQMMATLAGGFLPWIFRNILFKAPAGLALDTTNLNFQNHFNRIIKNFHQSWPIYDIESDEIKRMPGRVEMDMVNTDISDYAVDVTETETMIGSEHKSFSPGEAADNKFDLMVILPKDSKPGTEMNGSVSMLAESEIDWELDNATGPDFDRFPNIVTV